MSTPSSSNSNVSLKKPNGMPPNLPLTDEYGSLLPQLLSSPRKCSAGTGMIWIMKAFDLFKNQPLLWFGISATLFVILMIFSSLPLLNILIVPVMFIFIAGIIKGAATQSQGGELRFDHLFAGFKTHWQPLGIIGLIYLVGVIICMIPMFMAMGSMMFAMLSGNMMAMDGSISNVSLGSMMFGYLLSMLLLIPLLMSIWFAPALIIMHDVEPITAMKKSFRGGMANILPMLVYGLVCVFLLPLVIMLTLGLGVFLVFPLLMLTYYTSYRDIWTDQPLSM